MLSAEKAKFKSALERASSQTTKEAQQNKKPSHTLGMESSLMMKIKAFLIPLTFDSSEFIEVFNNS